MSKKSSTFARFFINARTRIPYLYTYTHARKGETENNNKNNNK